MAIWMTSDWHFNHNKEFIYRVRGFNSIEEMNEAIIERHNSIVRPNDIVYCLGDCGLGGAGNEALISLKNYIECLNGNIVILRGNHDSDRRVDIYRTCKNVISAGEYATMLKYKKYHFYLSHYPSLTSNPGDGINQMISCLYGHTHQRTNFLDDKFYCYHVGVDSHDCYPVSIDTIINDINNKIQKEYL